MTHGEESGPETHQDSAVLTYLEGLLMHRVAGTHGATATQGGEAGSGNEDQRNKERAGLTLPGHSAQQDKTASHGGTTQHLKKARLLRSEAWTEREGQKRSTASAELNGQTEDHHDGMNGASQCKGESTLLASLLQSFSTRLQNVALSQHIVQNLIQQKASSPVRESDLEDKVSECSPGSAPSHFKGVTGNANMQNHSVRESYDHRQSSQERLSESPMTPQRRSRSPSSESLPCTERLKAVASLVNIRSSPAPSPKPSVACSQLALLLSSEAHLQQYSREQALKAQLAGRSASERLAAMATHQTQEKKQPTTSGHSQSSQDTLSSLHTKNGMSSQMSTSACRQSPGLSTGQNRSESSVRKTHPFRERRPFERHGRPSQNCSSLLLQLLNSHNTPQRLTRQGHMKEAVSIFSNRDSPLFSDSEHSNPASSLPKDSSDAESTHSSCSPIDLSLKGKINIPAPPSSSSSPALDKVTDSPKNRWMLDNSPPKVPQGLQEVQCPEMKPHHKVTLLELLLDHKNNEKANKSVDNPDLQPVTVPKVNSVCKTSPTVFYTGRCKDTTELSQACRMNSMSPKVLPVLPQGRDCNARTSPYILYSSSNQQSAPLDLCKAKTPSSSASVKETAFSASKLLQNLAQCGKQSTTPSPISKAPLPPFKRQTQELKTSSSATLLERLTAPGNKNSTPTGWEGTRVTSPVVAEPTQRGSEIENLLERRTVLQLLLGNKSQKEKSTNKRKRDSGRSISVERQPNHLKCHNNLDRPSPDITVKTEPVEEGEMFNNGKVINQYQNMLADPPKQSIHSLNQGHCQSATIKQEPLSPMAVYRDGLLSHLLQQQPRTLMPSPVEDSNNGYIKEEPAEYQGPTIPKKRKFSVEPEDHTEVIQHGICTSSGRQKDDSHRPTSGVPETRESSDPSSPPVALSPPAKSPPCESPSNENRGFNVLRQLLLSDNCLKELSQSRSVFSPMTPPVLNGSTIEPLNNGELQAFNQSQSPNKTSAVRTGISKPESLLDVHLTQDPSGSKPDITTQRESVSLVNGDKKIQDHQLDSPRLTKANPILYYMLQRSNAHLVRDRGELEPRSGQFRAQMMTKDDSEAFDLKMNLRQSPHNHGGSHSCESPWLNGSLKKS